MAGPFRRIAFILLGFTGLSLALLLALAVRQGQLYRGHQLLAAETEQLVFQLAVIREQVFEILIEERPDRMEPVVESLERLNSRLHGLADRLAATRTYRIGLLEGVDMAGLLLLIRTYQQGERSVQVVRGINQRLRGLAERLVLLDRGVEAEGRARLMGFQRLVIGVMALLLVGLVGLVLAGYRCLAGPLERLRRAVEDAAAGAPPVEFQPSGCQLLAPLEQGVATLLRRETPGPGVTAKGQAPPELFEVMVGVAHEVGDLVNGMINYAQVLADGLNGGSPQGDVAGKLIKAGERVAQMVQKLGFYGSGPAETEEFLPVEQVLRDALLLTSGPFARDGIQVGVDLPSPLLPVPVNARRMQAVFLNILTNARRALNQRYPGRDPGKRLAVKGENRERDGQPLLVLTFTDYGTGISAKKLAELEREEGGAGRLAAGRKIVEEHLGRLTVTSRPGESTTVTVELPRRS